jgi:acetyltransferase
VDGAPDVVIVAAPPTAVPETVAEAARKGAAAAVITTPELERDRGPLAEVIEGPARIAGLRVVGPNCLGVLLPRVQLNASFAARMPRRISAVIAACSASVRSIVGMSQRPLRHLA